ncbi:MAG: hypothetical protein CL897_01985 [Dehalococcoidia bacterium]|nr:hypothetical protein [Dehalococcoidia bacterium]
MTEFVRWEYARVVVAGMDQPIVANFSHNPDDDREYGPNDLADALRDLGDAGWEMVSDARVENWIGPTLVFREMLYFKRPHREG